MKSGITPGRATRKSVETGRPTNIRRSAEMGKPWNTLNKLSSTFTYVTRNHVQRTLFPMGAIPPTQRFSAAGFSPWPAHRGNKKGQLGVVKSGGVSMDIMHHYTSQSTWGFHSQKRWIFWAVEWWVYTGAAIGDATPHPWKSTMLHDATLWQMFT